jgi:hypothetical protein
MMKLYTEFVRLPDDDFVAAEIELSGELRAFTGCIGAIDGTHIAAHVPVADQKRFFNRKKKISQNVFAAVRFNMCFSFVLAGAGGSVNDATLYRWSANEKFVIPPGRFYLADAGFALSRGVVIPFSGTRYHLREFGEGERPATAEESFNLRHAKLRSVVERVFGSLKRRFKSCEKTRLSMNSRIRYILYIHSQVSGTSLRLRKVQ